MNNHFDDQIKDELLKNTEMSSPKLKEDIWNNIDAELFSDEKIEEKQVKKMKKKKRIVPFVTAAAAGIFLLFGSQTETGLAVIHQIKELFAPEKNVTQKIEGMEEDTNVTLNEGSGSDYVIYVDEERYKLEQGPDADKIVPKEPLGEIYPEVSMEIKQVKDQKPEEAVNELTAELKDELPTLSAPEEVNAPLTGYRMHGTAGTEWNSPVITVYVISNEKSGSYIITQRYFLEAAEGHGARFEQMLQEFHIVQAEEK